MQFWLNRPKCCQPSTKCLLLKIDSAVVEKLGRGIGLEGLFRDDFLESDRPGWKDQVSLFLKMMPCFGATMTSGNNRVAFASCFIHGRDRTRLVVSDFGFRSCGRRSDSVTSTMSRDCSHVTK